jgi:hypothetical protein
MNQQISDQEWQQLQDHIEGFLGSDSRKRYAENRIQTTFCSPVRDAVRK